VVWSRARPAKGDCKLRGFKQEGKAVFQGKVKRKKKEHETARTEDETENDAPDEEVEGGGRACRQKGWWNSGDVEAKLNTFNMISWLQKECNVIEEEALTKLQEVWDSSEQKDECIVCLNDLEGKFGEKGEGKCVRVGREDEDTSSNRPQLGGVVLAMQSAALNEDALLLYDNEAVLHVIRKWVGQGGKTTLATAPDGDILREIICLLTQRVRAGRATFLIKVKSHRGELINERADTLAEEGRTISDDDKRWDDLTDWMTFEVRKGDTTSCIRGGSKEEGR
jgi:ribonuclease HI